MKATTWMAIFTGVLAVFTVLLTFFTYLIVQVEQGANDTARRTQRAFVTFQGALTGSKVMNTEGEIVALRFSIPWKNAGITPTRRAQVKSNFQTLRNDIPKDFSYPDLSESDPSRAFVLGPGTEVTSAVTVPIATLESVAKSPDRLFIWGWMTYQDVFEDSPMRLTEYAIEIRGIRSTTGDLRDPTGTPIWETVTLSTHNCYDEDCADYQKRANQSTF